MSIASKLESHGQTNKLMVAVTVQLLLVIVSKIQFIVRLKKIQFIVGHFVKSQDWKERDRELLNLCGTV